MFKGPLGVLGRDWEFEVAHYCLDTSIYIWVKVKSILFCGLDLWLAVLCLAGFGNLPGDMVCYPE